jgi:hypothetical protein
MGKKLYTRIEEICKSLKIGFTEFFLAAFRAKFGERRGLAREARAAADKVRRHRSLRGRARAAVTDYLGSMHGTTAAPA